MEKGLDALLNETYDFDIDTVSRVEPASDDQDDLAILKAFYKCQQFVFQGMLKDVLDKHPLLSKIDTRIACLKKANILAFTNIKPRLVELAEKPNLNALAFYVSIDERKNWSEKITKLIANIESKKIKTPEEWEVLACSHVHDKIQLSNELEKVPTDIESVGINAILQYNNYLEAFEKNSDNWKKFWLKCRLYHTAFLNTQYGKAVQKAQLGYYARFFTSKQGNDSDLCNYLRASQAINAGAVPKSILEQYSGVFFSRENIALFLSKKYKPQKNDFKTPSEKYMLAWALFNCPKDADKKMGKNLLIDIANQPLKHGKLQKDSITKPSQYFNIGLDVHS